MAETGTPAAIRPITGTTAPRGMPSALCGMGLMRPREPWMTFGLKAPFCFGAAKLGATDSGSLTTSKARARCGSLRMKPRSSSAVISRWIPDFERRSSAAFISSKDGGTPASLRRSWININNSNCLRVNIAFKPSQLPRGQNCWIRPGTESEQNQNKL